MTPVIIIHGGAFTLPEDDLLPSELGVREAAEAGLMVFRQGGSSIDAVEAAVRSMEDNPIFNAGRGSSLTREGTVEVDGSIMDGRTRDFGAVGGVRNFLHPVSLARKVMEDGEHVFLCGEGALKFANEKGLGNCIRTDLVTEGALKRLQKTRLNLGLPSLPSDSDSGSHDTVGATAIDAEGNLAVAISTGGTTHKRPGRIGDTPIYGAGFYAENKKGAAGATGKGEAIIQTLLSYRIVTLLGNGMSCDMAAEEAMRIMDLETQGKPCGIIFLSAKGETGLSHNTQNMPWAIGHEGQGLSSGISRKKSVLP